MGKYEPKKFWIEATAITDNIHAAVLVEPKFPDSAAGAAMRSNIYEAVQLTKEVQQALNRNEVFGELVEVVEARIKEIDYYIKNDSNSLDRVTYSACEKELSKLKLLSKKAKAL